MTNTCCFCIGLRPGTIIITALLFISYSMVPFQNLYTTEKTITIYGKSSILPDVDVVEKEIDLSPQAMDYIFAVFLPVVTLAMLLSAILRKSEILFYTLITYIVLYILLIVYSSLGEEKGLWYQDKVPRTMPYYDFQTKKLRACPESISIVRSLFGYVISGYFLFVVYSYVQQLRQGIPTSGQVISA